MSADWPGRSEPALEWFDPTRSGVEVGSAWLETPNAEIIVRRFCSGAPIVGAVLGFAREVIQSEQDLPNWENYIQAEQYLRGVVHAVYFVVSSRPAPTTSQDDS